MTVDEAIRHLYTYSSTNGSGQTTQEQHEEAKLMAIKALESQQWIPCSERLPECGQYVLCSQDNGDVGEARWLGDEWLIPWDNVLLKQDEVFAWRELPEPWKGEQNG